MGLVGLQQWPHLILTMALDGVVDTMGPGQIPFAVAPRAQLLWTWQVSDSTLLHPPRAAIGIPATFSAVVW